MLALLTRLFPLWALLLSVIAYYTPTTFTPIGPWGCHAADADYVWHGRAPQTR
ncbi:sodium/bile acid symporter family protein [Atlantibacter hermannii]|nr:sodium/bile acid symporter family protein [Atlantibacter hermannii]